LLSCHISDARSIAFAWGQNDCVLWCADWVAKLTGHDPAKDWRGKYTSEAEAIAILRSMDLSVWADLADTNLPPTSVAHAHRGDIMLHPAGMLGICDGTHAYFLTDKGVTRIEFMKCIKAWEVG
jgi:hypothetical protein